MSSNQLREQALLSAAHLVAALSDRRFGLKSMSAELRDCVSILAGELDELGLLEPYRRPDGSLVAWDASADAYSRDVLRRASFVDDQPSDLPGSYRVML